VTGQETFEFAAAIAGVSIGLAAILVLSLFTIIGTWRLFRHASDASLGTTRAVLAIEELARRLAGQPAAPPLPADGNQLAELRQQAETLIDEQRRLQDMARNLLDTAAVEGGPAPAAIDDLESAVGRLDTTVGQMATSLANLIQLLERQQEGH
jgi:hypothetical protein